ncbi:MAG: glycosyltransferase family 2 protein, partial [Gammaproteobacteria bacterium]
LFLDDDTVILQQDFLSTLLREFDERPSSDALIPHGQASFALIEGRYDYHEPFFMTSRCMAYRRQVLEDLGGFVSDIIGQEDVEFVTRFYMAGKAVGLAANLNYYHPPLLVPNYRKPQAVGQSFYRLKKRYPLAIWLILLMNCMRHAPLLLLPWKRSREAGRFGYGFLLGVCRGIRCRENLTYT